MNCQELTQNFRIWLNHSEFISLLFTLCHSSQLMSVKTSFNGHRIHFLHLTLKRLSQPPNQLTSHCLSHWPVQFFSTLSVSEARFGAVGNPTQCQNKHLRYKQAISGEGSKLKSWLTCKWRCSLVGGMLWSEQATPVVAGTGVRLPFRTPWHWTKRHSKTRTWSRDLKAT